MQEIDAIHFTVPAVARRDGSLDYPAMFVPCSSTTGSSKQSGASLMIDLLQEFLPILVPSKDTELFQPAVIDSRASRAIIRLPGRRICCPRPEHDVVNRQRCIMGASRSLADDCLRMTLYLL